MRRLLFACLLCAGCGPAAGEDATVTLRFWGLGREGEVVAQLIPQFEQENPGIRVHVQQIPWTAAHEKLLTSHVGRSTPDVAQLGNTWVPEFAAINALEPLDARVAQSQIITRDAYFAGIWNTNLVDDTLFGVPWYVDTRVIFYRKDILAAAGYDSIPQDWAGWLRAMQAVKRNVGPDRYPIYLPSNEWAQPVIFGQQNGAALLRDGNNYGAFASPEFREAFEFYVNLFRAGLAPAQGLYDVANPFQEFTRGYFAMWITGPWNMGEMKRRLPPEMQDKWATSPMPGPDGAASGLSTAGGASLVLFRDSKHKDAAWKLIEFLSRTEQQVRFYELTGSLPARQEAWRRARLPEDEYARAFWTQLQRVTPLPAVPEIEGIVQRVAEHAESSIRGGVAVERALQAMDEDVDRMLEKRRWMARAQ
ncbi:MAG TPA: sugar ABC transporter substrate-binding protein [Longimicrobiales bacterium]|nr:sugar ABC transporter substrate-binding protein [Longimicrobiales bacterium]